MDIAELCDLADRNASDTARHFAQNDKGAIVTERNGTLLVASSVPITSLFHSSARRIEPKADPHRVLAATGAFATEHKRKMALWLSAASDVDLTEAARAAGLEVRFTLAGMAIRTPPTAGESGPGVELVRVTDTATAADFEQVHGELFAEAGRPFDAARHFASPDVLLASHVSGFVAYLDGRPASAAMIVATGRAAGLFEVATSTAARKRGLGELVSRAATRAGFEDGAEVVTLQATALGEPVYQRIGFETFTNYGACAILPTEQQLSEG
jgi:ribosomal protein S18 acetylase RimI-like enzyme